MSLGITTTSLPLVESTARKARPFLLARIAAALAAEIRVRRDMRLLSGLGDAALHDIGLARGGIENAVRCGREPRR
ncbi:DUF1127 domain-containing protein [Microvirga thermotolerans]|uniref:DUF1127 domain-containing protein n=1 Tax=Microvirga thermotolerans TaxID=2651334 RepID=A0A5P9JYS6_9HYPH|nr:DUF1127 domain-containing protein [Microvirga thermotolerans]QFU17583.1 DUF1127 domain-containing protein [Microvirga thermotolerans]